MRKIKKAPKAPYPQFNIPYNLETGESIKMKKAPPRRTKTRTNLGEAKTATSSLVRIPDLTDTISPNRRIKPKRKY